MFDPARFLIFMGGILLLMIVGFAIIGIAVFALVVAVVAGLITIITGLIQYARSRSS